MWERLEVATGLSPHISMGQNMLNIEKNSGKTIKYQREIILSLCLFVFFGGSFLLGKLPTLNTNDSHSFLSEPKILMGVITQIQLMISVFIVLAFRNTGFRTAIILNIFAISFAVFYMIGEKSAGSMPGVVSYAVALLIINLISTFHKRESQHIQKIEKQKAELEESEKNLYSQAYYDSLTDLPNREFFMGTLDMEIHRAIKKNEKLAVLFIDLDCFKMVNDTQGHAAGDEVLSQVAERFCDAAVGHVISRSGGDEFYALVRNAEYLTEAEETANKIMSVFNVPFQVGENEFFLSASIGIALFPYDGQDGVELIKKADMAMYEAKKRGKAQFAVYNKELEENLSKKMSLSNCLYRALENEEFSIHYQPQIRVKDGLLMGVEALMRWENPRWGDISPSEFIPLAEQSGLIRPMGLWAFETACFQSLKLKELAGRPVRMSVNFSLEQFKDQNLVADITEIIDRTAVDPSDIVIEITEGAALCTEYPVAEKLKSLKKIGLRIALDDFGKEYSSLNRIRSFPVDILKIDMDFVHGITKGNERDRAIVKTMIQLSGNLGIHVIAEGVEEADQLHFLEQEGCQEAQGFFFYPGLPGAEMEKLLTGSS